MSTSNSNATRAEFLNDLETLISALGDNRTTAARGVDRAFIARVGARIDDLLARWREYAPRTCESVDCDAIVTEPLDALCSSCKSGGTPTRREVLLRDLAEGSVIEAPPRENEIRKHALASHVCALLRDTLQVRRQEHDTDDASIAFTDASLRVLAPLIEAVDILESIIWASDGCRGHRGCNHTMEPWQRARALLAPKWQAECDRSTWPDPRADTQKGQV